MNHDLSLSVELVLLMEWILRKGQNELKELVKTALHSDLIEELKKMDSLDDKRVTEHLQTILLNFLIHIENLLLEHIEKIEFNNLDKKQISEVIRKIDVRTLNKNSLRISLQQVKDSFKRDTPTPSHDIQGTLFEKLLHNWVPEKNDHIN